MARQLRIQYEGAIYHLMSRGDRREEIFRDDLDRRAFSPRWAPPAKSFVLVAINISVPTELKLYKAILAAEHYWLAACHPIPRGPMKLLASTILKS